MRHEFADSLCQEFADTFEAGFFYLPLMGGLREGLRSSLLLSLRWCWSERTTGGGAWIEAAEVKMIAVDAKTPTVRLQPQREAGEGAADLVHAAGQTDGAATVHPAHQPAWRIVARL